MTDAIEEDDIGGTTALEVPKMCVQNLTVEYNAVGTRVVRFEDGILVRVENWSEIQTKSQYLADFPWEPDLE